MDLGRSEVAALVCGVEEGSVSTVLKLGHIEVGKSITLSVIEDDGEFWIEARGKRFGPYETREIAEALLCDVTLEWTE